MLRKKLRSFTILCLVFSGTIFSAHNLQGAQSEEEIQQEQEQRAREALRERFRAFYRNYLDQQAIQRLRQQEQAAHESQPQQSLTNSSLGNLLSEIMTSLEQNFSPQQLQELVSANNMDEAVNALAHLKQRIIEKFRMGKLNQNRILSAIHTDLKRMSRRNIVQQLLGIPFKKLPSHTAELSESIFRAEEEAFSVIILLLQQMGTQSLDTFLSNINEQILGYINVLLSSLDLKAEPSQEYQIAAYILNMLNIDAPVDTKNRTLLIHFALQGNCEKAELLCQNGANPYKKDDTGRRAIDYARQYGHTEVEQLLCSFAHRDQEIATLTDCFDTSLPNRGIPRDIVTVIRDFAHADDVLQELSTRFEDKKSIKKHYEDEAFKNFMLVTAKQMLHAYQFSQQL